MLGPVTWSSLLPLRASLLAFIGNEVGHSALTLNWIGPELLGLLTFFVLVHGSPFASPRVSLFHKLAHLLYYFQGLALPGALSLIGLGPPPLLP